MQVVSFPARQARNHYRHELRTLTYVTLDAANGGIIRNLNSQGVAVQAVAPLRPQQRVRVRFELRFPRLRVETYGRVSWAHPSGQCGIRFVDLPARTAHQIDEWIFSNFLDVAGRQAANLRPIFGSSAASSAGSSAHQVTQEENASEENDGLTVSPPARQPIRLEPSQAGRDEAGLDEILRPHPSHEPDLMEPGYRPDMPMNWLSRPLSGRTLAWLVDGLLVLAGVLLFGLIFLSIAHELPPWPITLGAGFSATVFIAAAYWILSVVFEGATLGARLAEAAELADDKETDAADRFR
jgi:hypothetical protein